MRKLIFFLVITSCYWQLISCNSASPEKYFDIAVLNCNMMNGFAGMGLQREMETPSVKMIDGDKDKIAPMKRKEVIEDKIQTLEANQEKLKGLKETDDARDMLKASSALYEFVLPVYKNEYRELASLYDVNASRGNIESYTQSISDKYYAGYAKRFQKLTDAGKAFAETHGIKVNWDVQTSPR
jgi:hypothetical protein